MDQFELEEEALDTELENGEISQNEHNAAMRELQRDYRSEAAEAAQNAYDSEIQAQVSFVYKEENGFYYIPRIHPCDVKLAYYTDGNKLPYLSEFYDSSPWYAGADS